MSSRRKFIREAGFAGLFGMALPGSIIQWQEETNRRFENLPDKESEDFWNFIRNEYTVSRSVINLNNGGVSPQPKVVQQAEERFKALSNEAPSYYMWRILDQGREPLRENLAKLAGCNSEELAICRNTSEALETVIFGLNLKKGDEIVLCKQDYPNMINAWKQREQRDGIVLKWVDLELPIEDDQLLVDAYTSLFSSKTRLVHITQMINWTGQILPVKSIAKKARDKGIEVLVDGAHTFAHLDFKSACDGIKVHFGLFNGFVKYPS